MTKNKIMKREIKFRGWDGGIWPNVFISGDLWTNDISQDVWHSGPIMQFVGIQDKNGKEVYEGDIVTVEPHSIIGGGSWTEQTCVVSFINGSFVVDSSKFHNTICRIKSYLTVIGNIYENPELIEATKVQSSEPKVEDGY